MRTKIWNRIVIGSFICALILIAVFQIFIDPFMHYHGKLVFLEYPLKDERYINDGLQRHEEYEILITGTSMSQNFYASELENLWGKKTLKTAYSGASVHELSTSMENALSYNPNIKIIICSLDPGKIADDAEAEAYEGIPYYLYDNNYFNDVNYIFNKEVILKSIAVLNYTRSGQKTPSLDTYGRFDTWLPCGREAVLSSYSRMEKMDLSVPFSEENRQEIYENLKTNYIELAQNHPEVQFVFFLPPYSYCFWDGLVRTNQLDYNIEAMKYCVGLMLETDNISVFSFFQWDDVATDLSYYSDTLHYNGEICNRIGRAIYADEGRLTKDNYIAYFESISKLYSTMDYSSLD